MLKVLLLLLLLVSCNDVLKSNSKLSSSETTTVSGSSDAVFFPAPSSTRSCLEARNCRPASSSAITSSSFCGLRARRAPSPTDMEYALAAAAASLVFPWVLGSLMAAKETPRLSALTGESRHVSMAALGGFFFPVFSRSIMLMSSE